MLVGVAFLPPSLIPALQNIGILHHKKAELRILLQQSVYHSHHSNIRFCCRIRVLIDSTVAS